VGTPLRSAGGPGAPPIPCAGPPRPGLRAPSAPSGSARWRGRRWGSRWGWYAAGPGAAAVGTRAGTGTAVPHTGPPPRLRQR
jgi:hypothetical protein